MTAQHSRDRYLAMLKTALGPEIMPWLEDDTVIEIMLNPDGRVLVERFDHGKQFSGSTVSYDQAETIIKLVASYKNLVVDEANPEIATEIPFAGERFQGWLPPVVAQPAFTIRKRATQIYTLDDYVKQEALSKTKKNQLVKALQDKLNIMIVGGTGSGKTTFVNALLHELNGSEERILILEDLPELQVNVEDKVHMATTPTVTMRQLIKGSLRMRPNRIIIGEVRDGAALEMLKAWNTGHPGGIGTLHANSIESTPGRLEDLIQEAVMHIPRNLILEALDMVVFIKRDKAGKHRVETIAKLVDFTQNQYQFKTI